VQPEVITLGILWYIVFLFSTVCHEGAHALVAKWGGDLTAFHGGQVSLNPWPHIRREPFGMVVFPILTYVMGGWMMGWASAPYDPAWERRHPRRAAWMALNRFVAAHGVPLLAGGPGTGLVHAGRGVVYFNSAHLIAPGQGLRTYHKRHLVPFAERWPSFLGAPPAGLAADLAGLEPGDVPGVFPLDDGAFGVLICFEITDAAAARALAARGVRFVVNLTNDAWFESAPHLAWAAIRAVETGVPVVRAANAGVSAVFDRFGRARTRRGAGWLVTRVPAVVPTVYARRGDVFLGACLAALLAGLLRAVLAR